MGLDYKGYVHFGFPSSGMKTLKKDSVIFLSGSRHGVLIKQGILIMLNRIGRLSVLCELMTLEKSKRKREPFDN